MGKEKNPCCKAHYQCEGPPWNNHVHPLNNLPMHDRLECTHSHGALLDLPDSHQPHPNGSTPTIQPTLFALSFFPQLPLLFIFCRPLQHHRSSSSLLEQCLLCSLLQFPSVLADCLEPEPIKKNTNTLKSTFWARVWLHLITLHSGCGAISTTVTSATKEWDLGV